MHHHTKTYPNPVETLHLADQGAHVCSSSENALQHDAVHTLLLLFLLSDTVTLTLTETLHFVGQRVQAHIAASLADALVNDVVHGLWSRRPHAHAALVPLRGLEVRPAGRHSLHCLSEVRPTIPQRHLGRCQGVEPAPHPLLLVNALS